MSDIWRVYKLNDCDWWIARSLEEAKADYLANCGETVDDDAHELTNEDMDRLKIAESDENERRTGKYFTFREYLDQRIAEGLSAPEMFASTEY